MEGAAVRGKAYDIPKRLVWERSGRMGTTEIQAVPAREPHVRFCEGGEVKSPSATRPVLARLEDTRKEAGAWRSHEEC